MIEDFDKFKSSRRYWQLIKKLRKIRARKLKDLHERKQFLTKIERILIVIIGEKEAAERKILEAEGKYIKPRRGLERQSP